MSLPVAALLDIWEKVAGMCKPELPSFYKSFWVPGYSGFPHVQIPQLKTPEHVWLPAPASTTLRLPPQYWLQIFNPLPSPWGDFEARTQ